MKLDILLQDLRYTSARSAATAASPSSPFSFWPSASAPTSLSSAWSTLSCCARCRFLTRSDWSGSPRRPPSAAFPAPPTLLTLTTNSALSRSYQDVTGYFAFSGPGNLSLKAGRRAHPRHQHRRHRQFLSGSRRAARHGPPFRPEDAATALPRSLLLTDAWWRTQFNADPAIVGKAFDMNGQQTTVIGVLPRTSTSAPSFRPA